MSYANYDESIQHHNTPTPMTAISDVAGELKPKRDKLLPKTAVMECVLFDPNSRTYEVEINKKLCRKNQYGFKSLAEAKTWRDAVLEAAAIEIKQAETKASKSDKVSDENLIKEYAKRYRAAEVLMRQTEEMQKELIARINQGRAKKGMFLRVLAAKSKLSVSRVTSITYNTATLKPSEARALLNAING